MALHHGEPGSGLYLEGDETSNQEGEGASDASDVPTDHETLYSEFMRDEYVEWPAYDFNGSHDRAQLSAFEQLHKFSRRRAQASCRLVPQSK